MRFTEDKKSRIVFYLLEKIKQKKGNVSRAVAEEFGVNQATVHGYINELLKAHVLCRVKRGEYALAQQEYRYVLKRSAGDLDSDTYAYTVCMQEHIASLRDDAALQFYAKALPGGL